MWGRQGLPMSSALRSYSSPPEASSWMPLDSTLLISRDERRRYEGGTGVSSSLPSAAPSRFNIWSCCDCVVVADGPEDDEEEASDFMLCIPFVLFVSADPVSSQSGTCAAMCSIAWPAATRVSQLLLRRYGRTFAAKNKLHAQEARVSAWNHTLYRRLCRS